MESKIKAFKYDKDAMKGDVNTQHNIYINILLLSPRRFQKLLNFNKTHINIVTNIHPCNEGLIIFDF